MRLLFILLSCSFVSLNLRAGLSQEQADAWLVKTWETHLAKIRTDRAPEMQEGVLTLGENQMRLGGIKRYGKKPPEGWALFISMHGGGGAPAHVNDSQWRNQIMLGDMYNPSNAIYVAPRAPGNTWDLWHQGFIDTFFDRLIDNLVAFEGVDPNAVYIMGYSAGGDGVYQLAPRMADRFAGAAMMAGHPNETIPDGLRNLPFALHVGGSDAAYNRNKVGEAWKVKLKELQEADPEGYPHQAVIHPGMGHWMNLQDRQAIPWLQQYKRNTTPKRVVWKQDNVLHHRFYWLAVPEGTAHKDQRIVVSLDGQTVKIEEASKTPQLLLRFNDRLLDLDKSVKVMGPEEKLLFEGTLPRSVNVAEKTFKERKDRDLTFFAELQVDLEQGTAVVTTDE